MEPGTRISLLGLLGLALLAAPAPAAPGGGGARERALAEVFPGAQVERRSWILDDARRSAVERRAQAKLGTSIVSAYVARHGDSLVGAAFLENRTVRTMPAVILTVIAPDTTVARVDVLAFHEPPDYLPARRWLDQLTGRRLSPSLWPGRDLPTLAGSTLSARAVAESARLALALYSVMLAPELASPSGHR